MLALQDKTEELYLKLAGWHQLKSKKWHHDSGLAVLTFGDALWAQLKRDNITRAHLL